MKSLFLLIIAFIFSTVVISQELQPLKLLPPQTEKGKTLMKALEERCTTREYSERAIESPGYLKRAVGSQWHKQGKGNETHSTYCHELAGN